MKGGLIDTHCHLDLVSVDEERDAVIQAAMAVGIGTFVVPGVHPDGWSNIASLADGSPGVRAAYGVHPMYADLVDETLLCRLGEWGERAVAIGEVGLDPAYPTPLEIQERALRGQIRVARTVGLPLLIHCRGSFQRMVTILREEDAAQVGGLMHGYSGSLEMARQFIGLGFAIALSGSVTWSGAQKTVRVARELSLEHLVLETDAPDMTPHPHRGEWNRPAWLMETVECVARIRGITVEQLAMATTDTACRVLRVNGGTG